jgi:hypothetical protein
MTDKFVISIPLREPEQHLPFTLEAGDKITDCSGLWTASDRIADALSKCDACGRRTFRVVTITSVITKQTALCGTHFIVSAKVFPELRCVRGPQGGIDPR